MDLKAIEVKLARATTLPILPNVASQLLRLTENPNANARDYERIISQDAAMAAKVLRTANSPYFGGHGQITTLQRALVQLGANTIRSICLTVAFQSALMNKPFSKRFRVVEFWKHSLAVASAAKVLAHIKRSPHAEEAFVAGLVHDIGKLALALFLPIEANRIYSLVELEKISDYEAEMQTLELTHQEIGLLAAERWSLPELYFAPISKHHTPLEDVFEIDPLTAFVHVGNALAYEMDLGFSPPGIWNSADPIVLDFLEIPEAQYEPIRLAIAKEIQVISKYIGLET
ncbi:MAG TPA: HDOD domain-containing protein [Chthonomonadaceae bacterium]|nr:HDOD domain-containing protein [Chthonomonadaceae bacterium]